MSTTIDAFYADQDHTETEGWAYVTDESGLQQFKITNAELYEAHCAKRDAEEAKRIEENNNFLLNFDLDCG